MRSKLKDKYNYSPLLNKVRLLKLRKEKQSIRQKDRFLAKQTEGQQKIQQLVLPPVPTSRLEWSLQVRPTIDGRKNIVQYIARAIDISGRKGRVYQKRQTCGS